MNKLYVVLETRDNKSTVYSGQVFDSYENAIIIKNLCNRINRYPEVTYSVRELKEVD